MAGSHRITNFQRKNLTVITAIPILYNINDSKNSGL